MVKWKKKKQYEQWPKCLEYNLFEITSTVWLKGLCLILQCSLWETVFKVPSQHSPSSITEFKTKVKFSDISCQV